MIEFLGRVSAALTRCVPNEINAASAKMIRGDLKEARKTWLKSFPDARQRTEADQTDYLAYVDVEGRYADFHSMRHFYISANADL